MEKNSFLATVALRLYPLKNKALPSRCDSRHPSTVVLTVPSKNKAADRSTAQSPPLQTNIERERRRTRRRRRRRRRRRSGRRSERRKGRRDDD